MNLSDISGRLAQEPFESFGLKLSNGRWIDVIDQASIYLPPRRPDLVIVFDSKDGGVIILEVDSISALETR
jgi:hypothetical protein